MKMKKICSILLSTVLAAGCIFSFTGCSGSSSVGNIDEITFSDGDKIAEIDVEGFGIIKAKLFPEIAPVGVENFITLAESGYYDGLKIHRVISGQCIQGGSLYGDGTGGSAVVGDTESFDIETDTRARNVYGALGYANNAGKNTTQFYIINNKEAQDLTQFDPANIEAAAEEQAAKKAEYDESAPAYAYYTYLETYYKSLAQFVKSADEKVTAKYQKGGVPVFDGGYTIFGQVFEGFEVIDAISAVSVTNSSSGELSKPVDDIIISSVKIVTYVAPTETTEETKDNKPSGGNKPSVNSPSSSEPETGSAQTGDDALNTVETKESEGSSQ